MLRKFKTMLSGLALASVMILSSNSANAQTPAGTAFTYQGRLDYAGIPVTDTCDFDFGLFEDSSGVSQIGATLSETQVEVDEGLFTVRLDFGSGVFDGDARWLEIAVQCSGDPGFTTLSPLQEVTPTPYAIYAETTGGIPGNIEEVWGIDGLAGGGTEGIVELFIVDEGVTTNKLGFEAVTNDKLGFEAVSNDKLGFQAVSNDKLEPDAVDSAKILNGAVITDDLNNDAVTGLKILNSTIDTVDLNNSAVDINKLGLNAVDSGKIVNGSVDTVDLANSAVDINKLGANAVDSGKIVNGSVDTVDLANSAVDINKLGPDAVDSSKILNSSVDTADLASSAVDTDKLSPDAVTSAKITDGTVQFSDIGQNLATDGQVMKWDDTVLPPPGAWVAADDDTGATGGWVDDGTVVRLETVTDAVGIGTPTPTEKLDVDGNIHASGTIKSGSSITIDGTTDTISSTGDLILDATDNVGIGTTLPTSPLTVDGFIESTTDGFKFPDGTTQATSAGAGGGSWSLTGNSGTNPPMDFLGTTDMQPLEIHVNGQRALRIEPNPSNVPNIIGGHGTNQASGVIGATIGGGGGGAEGPNEVGQDFGTVSGGSGNYVNGEFATIPGGEQNTANGQHSFAAGEQAQAMHDGTFVWADGMGPPFASTDVNQFLIQAAGGVGIGTNAPQEALDVDGTVRSQGIKMPTGAADGYVLTSDAAGVATWRSPSEAGRDWTGDQFRAHIFFPNPDLSGNVRIVEAPVPGKSRHITGIWLQATNDVSNIEVLFDMDPPPPGGPPPGGPGVLFMSGEEFWSSGGGAPISLTSSTSDPPPPNEGLLILINFTGGGGGGGAIPQGVYVTVTGYDGLSTPPNDPSRPQGSEYTSVDTMENYQTSTTEPDGDEVYYFWDWGDGETFGWDGPYPGGMSVNANHSWSNPGNYSVKVKAKDEWGQESGWSPSLSVEVTGP